MFVINNVGGNLPILVDPLSKIIGYRESISIFYAGFYLISKLKHHCRPFKASKKVIFFLFQAQFFSSSRCTSWKENQSLLSNHRQPLKTTQVGLKSASTTEAIFPTLSTCNS
jgi:hypothetical protein